MSGFQIYQDPSGDKIVGVSNPFPVQIMSGGGTGGGSGSTLSAVTTLQNAAVATGVGTVLPTSGYGVASLTISGTFVGTIAFEGQGADGSWYSINGRLRGGGSATATVNVGGLYEVNCMGLTAVRANITAYTSGSITVKGQSQALTPISDSVQLVGSGSIKGALANVTTAGTRVQLPSYACREVTLIAKKTNTGTIYVGGSDVSSTVYGCALDTKDSFTFSVSNTNLIWIDSSVSGEGVSYVSV